MRRYKYDVGDKVQCKDGTYHTIIERTTGNKNVSAYICKCEKGHIHKKNQVDINKRCPYCINFKVAKGINDISTTNKEMFALIKDKEFAYTHHDNSPEMTEFICPLCGYSAERSPKYIKQYGHMLQYSVYEIDNSERILSNIINDIKNKFEKTFDDQDSVYIFNLSKN